MTDQQTDLRVHLAFCLKQVPGLQLFWSPNQQFSLFPFQQETSSASSISDHFVLKFFLGKDRVFVKILFQQFPHPAKVRHTKHENWKNSKNACKASLMTRSAPNFHVLCDRLQLDGETTAISRSPYYACKIFKI